MAASAGWPPASWKAWRRLGIAALRLRHPLRPRPVPPGRSATAGSRSCRRTGWPSAIPGSSSGRMSPIRSASAARSRRCDGDADGPSRHVWHPAETVLAVAYDTPDRRLARPPRQHAAALVGPRGRSAAARRLQPRRPCRRAGATAPAPRRSRSVLYPSDDTPAGQELRLRQEYLLHLRLAAGPGPPPSRSSMATFARCPTSRDPAQRHASGDRRRRADAHAGRRARARLGRGLAHHHATRSTTPTTRCCRRRWRRWPVPLMERLLPRHMQIIYLINCAASRTGCAAERATGPRARRRLADRRKPWPARAHGHLAFLGSHKVNGVSALHTELMRRDRVPRPARALPGPHRQQDQRHHVPPLAVRGQSRADRAARRRASASACSTTPTAATACERSPTTPRFQRALRRRQRRATRRRWPGWSRERTGRRGRSRRAVRRADQAHPRVQAPAAQHPGDDRAVPRHARRADRRLGAAGEDLRRQGGRRATTGPS